MLGDQLVARRKQKGLSQKDFAIACGVTPTALNYYEKNKRNPAYGILKKMASVLEVTTDELLADYNLPPQNDRDFPEEMTGRYTTDELKSFYTAWAVLSISYHAAPEEVQDVILEILAPYSDQITQNP
jgi:transcriptional regulator with XRE-family HTH domain